MMRNPTATAVLLIRAALFLATLSCVTMLFLGLLPDSFMSWDAIEVAGICLFFFVALLLSLGGVSDNASRASFQPALIIWFFLLVSEELFNRGGGDAETALQGKYSAAAYGELSLWILTFFVLLILSFKTPQYLHEMCSGQNKWLLMFAGLCLLSTIYSPRLLFSAAWAFKLVLVTLVLGLCSSLIRTKTDLLSFVRATFWAFSFLVITAVYRAWADPSTGFEHGRLGQSPTSLSVIAGVLLVLSLTFSSLGYSVWPVIFTLLASTVMILAAGKAGVIGGILSATLFYLFKKKLGSALAVMIGMVALSIVLLLISTPLNSYFHLYADSGQADSFSGRTGLWDAAMPAIRKSPVLGHGFMSSRFASVEIGGYNLDWEADHLHNAFLDVLYNNGLIGLALLLIVHAITIKNLLQVIGSRGVPSFFRDIAVGSLAIYANLLVNAFFNTIMGGRPGALFMLFLAVFVWSGILQRLIARQMPRDRTALRGRAIPRQIQSFSEA